MNKMILLGQCEEQLMIFTKKIKEPTRRYYSQFGTTIMHATGGYSQSEQDLVYCVVGVEIQ